MGANYGTAGSDDDSEDDVIAEQAALAQAKFGGQMFSANRPGNQQNKKKKFDSAEYFLQAAQAQTQTL